MSKVIDSKDGIKFRVKGVGLDTTSVFSTPWINVDANFEYIHTSIESNNDFLIGNLLKISNKNVSLVTSIDDIRDPEYVLMRHLSTLDRKVIDLLLIDEKTVLDNLDDFPKIIQSLINSNIILEFGIKNPTSVDNIKKINDVLGERKIKYISLEICPLNFNYDVVSFSIENNITIIGFNPFGGHISSAGIIDSFSIPYLLGFISNYSDIVFLSGRDLVSSVFNCNYIYDNFINSYSSEKFILRKNIYKLYKPFKKIINTNLVIPEEDLVISYDSPDQIININDIIFSFNKSSSSSDEKINIDKNLRNEIESEVYNTLSVSKFPENSSFEMISAISRYHIIDVLKSRFDKKDGWDINVRKVTDNIIGIIVSRSFKKKMGFFKKSLYVTENKVFLSLVSKETKEIVFIETKDNDEKM